METIHIGNFDLLIEHGDHYLQINDVIDINALCSLIEEKYSSYQIDFCYHNITPPLQELRQIGASHLDDCLEMRYKIKEQYNYSYINIIRVTKDNYAAFAEYHDLKNGDMYWNSQRIFERFNDWCVFINSNNQQINGYVLLSLWDKRVAEVYILEAPHQEVGMSLLKCAINIARQTSHQEILAMVDRNSLAQSCCQELCFIETGFYQSFRKEPS